MLFPVFTQDVLRRQDVGKWTRSNAEVSNIGFVHTRYAQK